MIFARCRSNYLPGMAVAILLLGATSLGCFSEQSFSMHPDDVIRLSAKTVSQSGARSTRAWLRQAHRQMKHLLPTDSSEPLLTEQLSEPDGSPTDVFDHFGIRDRSLQSMFENFHGIRYTAQGASQDSHIDNPPPPWPEFDDVWVPVNDTLSLPARLGYARKGDGQIRSADCIVILPGFFGDNGVKRTRDLAIGLRESGYHVMALEIRGHGQAEARYPDIPFTFGVLETDDLMHVSDWLERLPHVQRTGLIGYCWTANIALLAAWYDGREPNDPMIAPMLKPYLPAKPTRSRFAAGVIAFSSVLQWEEFVDTLDTPRSYWVEPIFAAIQNIIRDRMARKNHPERTGNLRHLIEFEYADYGPPLACHTDAGYRFLRLLPYKNKPAGDKLERACVPTLIVHGANDPLRPAQDVADLIATVENPNVAAIILPSGGHVGFAAYAKPYYFSLISNFFDPAVGPGAMASR